MDTKSGQNVPALVFWGLPPFPREINLQKGSDFSTFHVNKILPQTVRSIVGDWQFL
jgi:hypothetical protein